MTQRPSRPIAVDLFAGAGGFSLGLEQAGFDIVVAIDRDPYHIATYRRNFPHVKAVCAPIQDLTSSDVREAIGSDRDIDLVCGGPPCQGFSHMGKRDAADPRNALVDEFVRLVVELQPKTFLLENVPGMQLGRGAEVISRTANRLRDGGYLITEPVRTLNAAAFGVPQRRERMFIIGVRSDFGISVPYPSSPCKHQSPRPTVWEAISDLPPLLGREDLLADDVTAYPPFPQEQFHPYVLAARDLLRCPCDLSYRRTWTRTHCSGCQRVRHSAEVEELYAATAPGASVPAHNLPRLDPDGLAPTLRAGTDSEHGSYNAPRPVHPYEPRCITVREAARLHGYPDWFRFYPRKWHAHRQIGNSVCPPVAQALGRAIIETLRMHAAEASVSLPVADDFPLPAKHRHHRRISQLEEWPKVLKELLARAGRTARGRLRRPDFSIADVALAYKASGARMPRTPPERFLADLARSRNTRAILSPITTAGYSIIPLSQNGTYGRFVPLGTRGTVEAKEFLAISRAELGQAKRLRSERKILATPDSLTSLVCRRAVTRALFHVGSIRFSRSSAAGLTSRGRELLPFDVVEGKRCLRKGVAILVERGDLPTLPAVRTILERFHVGTALIIATLTQRHFAAIVLRRRGGYVTETRRRTFELAANGRDPGRTSRISSAARPVWRGSGDARHRDEHAGARA